MQYKGEIDKLTNEEQIERTAHNNMKSLECCIKILRYYLDENEYLGLLEQMTELSGKSSQSFLSIFGMLKFTIKKLYPVIQSSQDLMSRYLTTILHILSSLHHSNPIDSLNEIISLLRDKNINANLSKVFLMIEAFEFNDVDTTNVTVSPNGNHSEIVTTTSSNRKDLNTTGMGMINSNTHTPNSKAYSKISKLNQDNITFSKQAKSSLLPNILLLIEITMNNTQLKQSLQETMLNLNTTLSPNHTQSDAVFTVTKKDSNIIRNICQLMFPSSNDITLLQCKIKHNGTNRYDRLIELKSLSGNPYTLEALIVSFIKKLIPLSKSIQIIRNSEGFFAELAKDIQKGFNAQLKEVYTSMQLYEEKTSMIETINREAANYYEIYRILSQENYDLGKMISEFIIDFKQRHSSSSTSNEESIKLIPAQMKEIMGVIDQCVGTFNNYFNFGKSNMEKMLKCCRPAVEKYLFNKLYYLLYDIYDRKYSEMNTVFKAKQKSISDTMALKEMMSFLEIKECFWALDNYDMYHCVPYKSTIDCLNKIDYEQSPREKFDTMIKAGLDLRNTILGNGIGGRNDLSSMDDELPLFIYVSTQVNLRNVFAELHMVEDYLRYSSSEDKESKVLTNLLSAVFYITSGWDVNGKDNKEKDSISNE